MTNEEIKTNCSINTIRTLSIDAVQQAKSGHPGTPMALAPLVYTIWNRVMRFDPRTRFGPTAIGSCCRTATPRCCSGPSSPDRNQSGERGLRAPGPALGSLDDIRRFRQLDSKAPGHPEYHWVSGVETTSGPLGQGVATSVGMAIGQKWLASRYNRPGFDIFDYHIYAVCGDGCMMEGRLSGSGVAGGPPRPGQPLLGLRQQPHHDRREYANRLHGGHRGPVPGLLVGTFCGSAMLTISIGSSMPCRCFAETKGRPTFLILDSHIGYGSPHKQDTAEAHGEPLGEEEVRLAKRSYGWPEDVKFLSPMASGALRGRSGRARGESQTPMDGSFATYAVKYPELATEIDQMQRRELPIGWDRNLPVFPVIRRARRPGSLGQSA